MELSIYNQFQRDVLKDICSERLCFIKFVRRGYTKKGVIFHVYEIKTIGLDKYIKESYFVYLDWLKKDYPRFR
ncbi:hypothetical protein [Flavobacterium phage FLiP]|uniref:Uncharacterized protein n=1 Tax=Flavobacterium phage FLiP TaxID=2023716 RepID=A0A222NP87_9VIRU|nr:hypothetical protein HOR88_gp06 [Flavobacterium phage FLiP]ASQ41226.1 hypothetical protein [Flavobacterium phage FLiP]